MMTATLRQRGRPTWARAAIRRMIGTLGYINEELVRAHEAMARPAGARQPGPYAHTEPNGAPAPGGGVSVPARPQRAATGDGAKPAA